MILVLLQKHFAKPPVGLKVCNIPYMEPRVGCPLLRGSGVPYFEGLISLIFKAWTIPPLILEDWTIPPSFLEDWTIPYSREFDHRSALDFNLAHQITVER